MDKSYRGLAGQPVYHQDIPQMKPPLLGRDSKENHWIVLHELRLMSAYGFFDWLKGRSIYNLESHIKPPLINTRRLEQINDWGESEWGIWNTVLPHWRQFAKEQAGF